MDSIVIWYYIAILFMGLIAWCVGSWHARQKCSQCTNPICKASSYTLLSQRRFRPIKLKGKECSLVQEAFQRRLTNHWLALKLPRVRKWRRVLNHSKYCLIKPSVTGRVGGWCDKQNHNTNALVVGLEAWVMLVGPFRDSAIDHELTHCRQEFYRKTISQSWDPNLKWRDYFVLWLQAEPEAVLRNPLWPLSVLAMLTPPIVAYLIQLLAK